MSTKPKPPFAWPNGKQFAISLSFDDGRRSQLSVAMPILDAHGVRATFYVLPDAVASQPSEWADAARRGHELGNHTSTHPCSENFEWSRHNGLESYTLERIEGEILAANAKIEQMTGVAPTTFAYPCGQSFIGRGAGLKSYVPVVAAHFLAGRGYRDESWNDPVACDLAQLCGTAFDATTRADLEALINQVRRAGGWLVLAGHDTGESGHQTVDSNVLDWLCETATASNSDIWIDTVAAVAEHVRAARQGRTKNDV